MANNKKIFSLSHFLYQVGEKILFQPAEKFAVMGKRESFLDEDYTPSVFHSQKMKVKTLLAKAKEQSLFYDLVTSLVQKLFSTRIRSFGVFFFSCGFLQIFSYFLSLAFPFFPGEAENLLFGVCLVFLTLFCSFARGDLGDAVRGSFFFRKILLDVFGLEEWRLPTGRSKDRIWTMLLFGVFFGILSVIFSPIGVLLVFVAALLACFVFYKPEAGLTLSVVALLLFDTSLLLYPLLLTLASFLLKCAVGKRSLVFSWMDLVALLAILPFSAIGGEGRWRIGFALAILYFLTGCLIRQTRQLARLMTAVVYVMFFAAVVLCAREGLCRFVPFLLARFPKVIAILRFLPDEQTGSVLAVLCPWVLGLSRSVPGRGKKFFCLLTFVLMTVSIALVGSYGIWLGYFLALAVQFLFSYRSSLILLVMGALSFLSATFLLPRERVADVLSFFGFTDSSNLFSASDVGGLFSVVSQSFGVWGMIWIGCLMALFLFEVYRFQTKVTQTEVFPMILALLASSVCFFALGYQEIAFSHRLPAIFLLLSALPRAAYRSAVREETRLTY